MKTTQYFNSQAELEAFYPNGVPNNVLAIVTDETSGQANILMTSSNNANGTPQEQGGEILTPETEARIDALEENKADKADTYTKTEVDELISSSEPDLSYYVTKEALSGMSYATESYVTSKISDVVGAAPETLDTLKELADALNDDAQFASYVAVELGKKADLANVYTKNEIQNMSYITSDALNGYATESYVTSAIAAIDIPDPDLTAYVSDVEEEAIWHRFAERLGLIWEGHTFTNLTEYNGNTEEAALEFLCFDTEIYYGNYQMGFRVTSNDANGLKVGTSMMGFNVIETVQNGVSFTDNNKSIEIDFSNYLNYLATPITNNYTVQLHNHIFYGGNVLSLLDITTGSDWMKVRFCEKNYTGGNSVNINLTNYPIWQNIPMTGKGKLYETQDHGYVVEYTFTFQSL